MAGKHLYKTSKRKRAAVKAQFTKRYGKRGGKKKGGGEYVYGATVGKLYRERHHGRNWNERR